MPNENNELALEPMMSAIMYAMLTDENKNIIDRLIEQLITEQSSNQQ